MHQDSLCACLLNSLRGYLDRVPGAELRLLDDRVHGFGQRLSYLVRSIPEHDHNALRASRLEKVEHPLNQRLAAKRVQHFVESGAHPCALAGGEHDRDQGVGTWRLPHVSLCSHWGLRRLRFWSVVRP
jgi:hypothetical protein